MRDEELNLRIKNNKYGAVETSEENDDYSNKHKKSYFSFHWFISNLTPRFNSDGDKTLPFYKLFRYATWKERLAIFLSMMFAVLVGLCMPFCTVLYAEFTTLLIDRATMTGTSSESVLLSWFGGGKLLTNASFEENKQALLDDSIAFGVGCTAVSLVKFVFGAFCVDLMNFSALRQISRIRKKFFETLLRQDMTWYDTNTETNFASSSTEDIAKLQNGIGEKVAIFVYLLFCFLGSIITSFFYGWELTLVILSCAPLIVIATAIVAKVQSSLTEKELKSYGLAGSCAEEVLSSIRTVVAFGGEQKEIDRYSERLVPATNTGIRKGVYSGIGNGLMWFIIFATYSLAFWYGVLLILEDREKDVKEYTPAVLIIVFFSVLAGSQSMGLTSPHLEAFAVARGSATNIFKLLDRPSGIDPLSSTGLKSNQFIGKIEFKDVHFQYPSRKEVKVLKGLNLTIKPGERVAFVGSSGCGKSTLIQLIQRLYDPANGRVLIDDVDAKEFNVAWLRSHMGVVGQEPVLFATSVYENIIHGCPNATKEDVERAAVEANCHGFIEDLPEGYNTVIGERGSQLSGGQKQRIAIARALIRQPSILLLDEATSALDYRSEAEVQKALDKASFKCTTIIVSHRLSTIRHVDRIIFIKDGVVVEVGTHEELMEKQGLYWNLVQADTVPAKKNRKKLNTTKSQVNLSNLDNSYEESPKSFLDDAEGSISEETETYKASLGRVLKMNAPEWLFLLVGSVSAIIVGASAPIFAVVFGEIYGVLSDNDTTHVEDAIKYYALIFLITGIVTGISGFLQTYMFNFAGVRLTTRIRVSCFAAMLKQEMGWFDQAKNSVGSLCARLSGDAAGMQGATGSWIGAVLTAFSTFILGVVISFYYTWKLTLVSLVPCLLVIGGVVLEGRVMSSEAIKGKKATDRTTKIAVEAIANIRTVAGLGAEKYFIKRYAEELEELNRTIKKSNRLRGAVFSFGQAAPFFGYALSLYYGGSLVSSKELDYKEVIKVSEALLFGAFTMGQTLAFAPNFNAAKVSAGRIFQLLDRIPLIASPVVNDNKNWRCEGEVSCSNIHFHYPVRQEKAVLQGLDLQVSAGRKIALVGRSGCGKSTCIQLLQRFYDPDDGTVCLDGLNIRRDISLELLRSQLGIVSQEPVLFDRTIAENISYGDNSRQVSHQEIQKVATAANIHAFVASLPMGYDTRLGTRGSHLSGGQKQRIAIARALIRDPRILLLDEATSALDNHSEQVVQSALDSACDGRTCVIVAHRLSTVRNADIICVIDNGKIVENGTHDELMSKEGLYYQLYCFNK